MKKKVALYARVSTNDQSTQLQLNEITQYALSRGWEIFQVYEDKATGTHSNRRQLRSLLKDAKVRKFDVVLCWKLDRLFRSLKDLVTTLQEFSDLGIKFVSLKDNIDMTTASGRLLTHVIAAMAEFEASLIKERVTAGVRAKIKKTGHWGRTKKRDDLKILRLKAEGYSNREVARQLNVSEATIRRALKGATITPLFCSS